MNRPEGSIVPAEATERPVYEPPRIITHSAEHLDGLTIHVNACTSAFGSSSAADPDADSTETVTY